MNVQLFFFFSSSFLRYSSPIGNLRLSFGVALGRLTAPAAFIAVAPSAEERPRANSPGGVGGRVRWVYTVSRLYKASAAAPPAAASSSTRSLSVCKYVSAGSSRWSSRRYSMLGPLGPTALWIRAAVVSTCSGPTKLAFAGEPTYTTQRISRRPAASRGRPARISSTSSPASASAGAETWKTTSSAA